MDGVGYLTESVCPCGANDDGDLKWWRRSGMDGFESWGIPSGPWNMFGEGGGDNILTANLIAYDDSAMADTTINMECFCVRLKGFTVWTVSLVGQMKQTNQTQPGLAAQSRNMYFLWLTSCRHFTATSPFPFWISIRVCCILLCSFDFDVSVENCKA